MELLAGNDNEGAPAALVGMDIRGMDDDLCVTSRVCVGPGHTENMVLYEWQFNDERQTNAPTRSRIAKENEVGAQASVADRNSTGSFCR